MPNFPIRLSGRHAAPETMRAMFSGLIQHAFIPKLWWRQIVDVSDFAGVGATTQELDLNVLFPNNSFPMNVDLDEGTHVRNLVLPVGTGISAVTIEVGDTGDPDGLVTASNVLGSGAAAGDLLQTTGAAQYARRPETAFVPTLTINTTGGNVNAQTAFRVQVCIPWNPRTEI